MNLFLVRTLLPLMYSLLLVHAAYLVGYYTLRFIPTIPALRGAVRLGTHVLLGYALLGYAVLVITLFVPLTPVIAWGLVVLPLVSGYKEIVRLYRSFLGEARGVMAWHWFDASIGIAIIGAFIFYLISALVPPYRIDALAYHLPEAMQIAKGGIFSMGGYGYFYENLPKLMETLYALPYALSGFSLVSLVHYQILLAGFAVVFGFIKREFNFRAALLSTLLLFTVYDLLVNATSQFIDGATLAYELSAFLFVLYYCKYQEKYWLLLGGALYGFALSVKYLPMYSLFLTLGILFYTQWQRKIPLRQVLNHLAFFVISAFVCGGFWYIKNLLVVHNPTYPFIFGHQGFTSEAIAAANIAIKQYAVTRTPIHFVLLPFIFFLNPYYLSVFAAFCLAPVALIIRNNSLIVRYIAVAAVLYFAEWFFAISHQKRFGMFGIVLLMLLASVTMAWFIERYERVALSWYCMGALACVVGAAGYVITTYKQHYFVKVKKTELNYVLGKSTEEQFFNEREQNIGAVYTLSRYINSHYQSTTFLNLWDATGFFLSNGNSFVPPLDFISRSATTTSSTLRAYFVGQHIQYVVTNSAAAKARYVSDEQRANPADVDYAQKVLSVVYTIEKLLPQLGIIVYENENRVIYKIR